MERNQFTFIDLFSGIGGFKMALSKNGGICLGFSEINKDAINTYCENFNISPEMNFGDITKIRELPPHDLLTAGVPCQSWSIAGRNLGFDDDRGQLWNDTIYLLKQTQPKAFIFENVKGLVDPRNQKALNYILERIKSAGYFANYFVINSFDYGVPQNRVRIYIVGFKEKTFFEKFNLPKPIKEKFKLADILNIELIESSSQATVQRDLFGEVATQKSMSLSSKNGFNDYFLFNDLRNGETTIHSWDILETTDRQKEICLLLLRNRRKSAYGKLDGNPLAFHQFKSLDSSILQSELDELVELGIFKTEEYTFSVVKVENVDLTEAETELLSKAANHKLVVDDLKSNRSLKLNKIPILKTIESLQEKNIINCTEIRYDFKNTKISTGLFGINRVFLPSSDIFPTLVASDTNDFVTLKQIRAKNHKEYKNKFLKDVYETGEYRKITKSEACQMQGFPKDFILPDSRARWMKLVGNSVSVPVVEKLCKAIIETGVFKQQDFSTSPVGANNHKIGQK